MKGGGDCHCLPKLANVLPLRKAWLIQRMYIANTKRSSRKTLQTTRNWRKSWALQSQTMCCNAGSKARKEKKLNSKYWVMLPNANAGKSSSEKSNSPKRQLTPYGAYATTAV